MILNNNTGFSKTSLVARTKTEYKKHKIVKVKLKIYYSPTQSIHVSHMHLHLQPNMT